MPNRRIAMVVHSYLDEDPRVRREGRHLVAAGYEVEAWGLRRPGDQPSGELDGMAIHRLPVERHQGAPLWVYLLEYALFALHAVVSVYWAHLRRPFRLLIVHAPPEPLLLLFLPLRLGGVRLVLDAHEATDELFRLRFGGSTAGRLLSPAIRWLIRLAALVADLEIVPTAPIRDLRIASGRRAERVVLLPNLPDQRFDPGVHPRRGFMADGRLRLVYTGALTPNYELETALFALARLRGGVGGPAIDAHLLVCGRGDRLPALQEEARQLGIAEAIEWRERVPHEDVPALLADTDIALAPTRTTGANYLAFPTKVAEAAALGVPVVASTLPLLEEWADAVLLHPAGDAAALEAAIRRLVDDPAERERRIAAGLRVRGAWERHAAAWAERLSAFFTRR